MASLFAQVALIAFIGALIGLSLWLFAQLQAYKEGLTQANMRNSRQQAMIRLQRDTLEELKSRPLKDIRDEALPVVIRSELLQRHHDAHMAAICFYSVQDHGAWEEKAHKLASKCGGAAFRVVDAIKRGKL